MRNALVAIAMAAGFALPAAAQNILEETGEAVGNVVEGAGEVTGDVVEGAGDAAGTVAEETGEAAGEVGEGIEEGADEAVDVEAGSGDVVVPGGGEGVDGDVPSTLGN